MPPLPRARCLATPNPNPNLNTSTNTNPDLLSSSHSPQLGHNQVPRDHPCDVAATTAREACATPTAYVTTSLVLSACDNTPLRLDGSSSVGGGAKELAFRWRAVPTACDNYYEVQAALDAANQGGQVDVMELSGALNGGSTFSFRLVVSNFLGAASSPVAVVISRAAAPIPEMSIDTPSQLHVRLGAEISLQASVALPGCYSGFDR